MAALEVTDLSIQLYIEEKVQNVVEQMSYSVNHGELFGVVGESGAGKSIHAKALMNVLPKEAKIANGTIVCQGTMAMVFQNPYTTLNPVMTIGQQLTETIKIHSNPKQISSKEKALELLDLVGIYKPQEKLKAYPHQLSGGMCQRVVIAIALACNPTVLVADEPTTALDMTVQAQILGLLRRIARERQVAIVLISHDLGVIASVCQRMLVMREGRVIESGTVEEVFYHPKEAYTQKLMQEVCIQQKSLITKKEPQPVLILKNVYQRYQDGDRKRAVQGVSFQVNAGENFGLVGESGCGKTTLAKMIVGIEKPSKGNITYYGDPMEVQMIFQDSYASLNPCMKIHQILLEPLLAKRRREKKKATSGEEAALEKKIRETIGEVGLSEELLNRYPKELSGGQRQRVGIARALVLDPKLLLCDEAVSAQDPKLRGQLLSLLQKLQNERGMAYLFISHDLGVVQNLSQRVGVMYQGQLVETGVASEVAEEPWHPYTKALLSAEPIPDPRKARKQKPVFLRGEEVEAEEGCPFARSCKYALEICRRKRPELSKFQYRQVACFLYSKEPEWTRDVNYQMTSQI